MQNENLLIMNMFSQDTTLTTAKPIASLCRTPKSINHSETFSARSRDTGGQFANVISNIEYIDLGSRKSLWEMTLQCNEYMLAAKKVSLRHLVKVPK